MLCKGAPSLEKLTEALVSIAHEGSAAGLLSLEHRLDQGIQIIDRVG